MLPLLLAILALLCSTAALSFTLWIIVPTPLYRLRFVAVVGSEWSLWFAALGLLGGILSLLALSLGSGLPGITALIMGVLAVTLAWLPPLQAWPVAQVNGVRLSLRQYIFGSDDEGVKVTPQTITFAMVEGQSLKLDLYLPADQTIKARPAVIVIHGGWWCRGDKGDFPKWNQWLARHGFAVFDIQYRLAPQPNWQIATGDIKCAIGWVKHHASEYGVDAGRIALMGRSAGGHLALLAASTSDNSQLMPSCGAPDTSVQAVIALYALTDLRWNYDHPANQKVVDGPDMIRRFLGGDPRTAAEAFRVASPTTHVNPNTPPTLLFHGGHDQMVREDNMALLFERLQAAKVPHRALLIPYAQHGFDYHLNGWASQIAQPLMLQFLQQYLASP